MDAGLDLLPRDEPPMLYLNRAASRKSLLTPDMIAGAVQIIDFSLIALAALIAFAGYFGGGTTTGALQPDRYILTALLGAALFVISLRRLGGYGFRNLLKLQWQLPRVATTWFGVVSVLLLLAFFAKVSIFYSRGWALTWTTATLGSLLVERIIVAVAIRRWSAQGHLTRNVIIVGAGEIGTRLIAKLRASHDEHFAILGVFDDRISRIPPDVLGCPVLGTTDELLQFARRNPVDEIIIALPLGADQRCKILVEKLRALPVDLRLSIEPLTHAVPVRGMSFAGSVPVLDIIERPLKQWNAIIKSIEDKIFGMLFFILASPFMALIAIAIKADSPGPVLFVQQRFGFNNQVIRVLKFRTMHTATGDPTGAQRTVRGDPRITRVGRWLRAFSLDELPQLINVLRGEMSLVGPRAHAIAMKAGGDRLYHDAVAEYAQRHRVKPGITGWAQVNGLRGEIDSDEKARQRVLYDLKYIDDWSLWLDLAIILLSVPILLKRENAY